MKFLGLFLSLLVSIGLASTALCQTAAQYLAAGNQTYAAKDYAKAVQYYQAAAQLDPKSSPAYQGLGSSYYQQGKTSDALAAFDKALALDPSNAQLANFANTLRAKTGTSAPATNESTPSASSPAGTGRPELDIMVGLNFALSNNGAYGVPAAYTSDISGGGYGAGFGGGAGIYFPMGDKILIGGNVSYYTFSSSSTSPTASGYGESITVKNSQNDIEVAVGGKYKLGGDNIQPYLMGGLGFSQVSTSGSVTMTGILNEGIDIPSTSSFAPMVQLGGGIQMPAGPNMNFFAEGKFNIILVGGSTLTETVMGFTEQVPVPGYTFIEFPLNVGLNFNL